MRCPAFLTRASSRLSHFCSWLSLHRTRCWLSLVLNLVAILLLFPGLFLPLFSLRVFLGSLVLSEQKRSILGTVQLLRDENAPLPAALIVIFSVVVPFIKLLLLAVIARCASLLWRWRLYVFVRGWSKWSMADVFVTAVFIAYLSANAAATTMHATLEPGQFEIGATARKNVR